LEKALVLLGLNNLKTIVSSALMKRLLVIAPVYFRMFGQHLWQHSLDCGQACRALAKYYGQCDANNAYLVGLMHDIGKLAIFGLLTKALGQHLDYKPRGSVFSGIVRDHSQELSVKIAEKWGLPEYLLTALSEQMGSHSPGDCSIYGFILNQANILAEFKAIAEKMVKTGQSFDALLELYTIPLHLFIEAFPEEYKILIATQA
jgi:HD-like signal output (HDOD) protein